jgi:hypothetical protein
MHLTGQAMVVEAGFAPKANRPMTAGIYSATITAGGLMLPEARRVARLMLAEPSKEDWTNAICTDNLLQKKTPASAIRHANLIRARMQTMPVAALTLVASGSQEVATQLAFASALKHSALLTDFMRAVVASHHRRLELVIARREWDTFLSECMARDPAVESWTASTRAKLFQVIVNMLVEAHYLESGKTLKLRTPSLHPQVRALLKQHGEQALINTLELRS